MALMESIKFLPMMTWGPLAAKMKEGGSGCAVEVSLDDVELFVHDLVAEPPADEEEEEEAAEPTLHDGVASAEISGFGYIKTALLPWAAKTLLGRITSWGPKGDHVHPSRISVSIKCYMHPRCSYARKRGRCTDDMMLRWLFSAWLLAYHATAAEIAEARAAHLRAATAMLAPLDAEE